jgi:hypothetical protein
VKHGGLCDRAMVVTHDDLVWLVVGNDREPEPREFLGLQSDEAQLLATALTDAAEATASRPPRRKPT